MNNVMTVKEIKNESKEVFFKEYTLLIENFEYEIITGGDRYILLKYEDNTTVLKDLRNDLYKKLNKEERKIFFKHLKLTADTIKDSSTLVAGSFNYLPKPATISSKESQKKLIKILTPKE